MLNFSASRRTIAAWSAALACTIMLGATPSVALNSQERLVEDARLSIESMLSDPSQPSLPNYVRQARAVLVFPELLRGGFIIGGEGGIGVMLAREPDGSWSYPAFVTMAAGSVGLQIGGQVSEMLLLVMTQEGLDSLMDRYVTLGADANVAAITMGAGVEARTGLDLNADMYAFSRNQGLFAGGALEGSVVSAYTDWNELYYNRGATPRAIFSGQYTNTHAQPLRDALPR